MQEKLSKAQLEKLGLEQKVRGAAFASIDHQHMLNNCCSSRRNQTHSRGGACMHAWKSVLGTRSAHSARCYSAHSANSRCCAVLPGVVQLSEKESTESALQKHQQQMREDLNKKLAECQEYRAMVHKLQAQIKEQEGKLVW